MGRGNSRILSLLSLTGLIVLACSSFGCRKGTTGVDLPRYPGAQYMALPRQEHGTYILYGAQLGTSHEARTIFEWYVKQVKPKGKWKISGGGQMGGLLVQNMRLDGRTPKPINPDQPGAYIQVVLGGSVTLYQSVPKKKEK